MVFYFKLNCSLFFEIGLRPMLTKYFIEYREIGKNIIKFYVLYDQTNSVLILPESCAFRNVQYSETQNTSNYMYKQVIWISFDTLFKLFSIFFNRQCDLFVSNGYLSIWFWYPNSLTKWLPTLKRIYISIHSWKIFFHGTAVHVGTN